MSGIKNQILDALKTDDKREFIRKLSETGELLFFGGVPRDIILIGDTTPRDFDIVVDFTDEEKFMQLINQMYEKQYRRYEYVKYTREELKKIIEEITEGNNGK